MLLELLCQMLQEFLVMNHRMSAAFSLSTTSWELLPNLAYSSKLICNKCKFYELVPMSEYANVHSWMYCIIQHSSSDRSIFYLLAKWLTLMTIFYLLAKWLTLMTIYYIWWQSDLLLWLYYICWQSDLLLWLSNLASLTEHVLNVA